MLIRLNDCNGCPDCRGCGRDEDYFGFQCDICESEAEFLYAIGDKECCEYCFLDEIKRIFQAGHSIDEQYEIIRGIINDNQIFPFRIETDGKTYYFTGYEDSLYTLEEIIDEGIMSICDCYSNDEIAQLFGINYSFLE